MSTGYFRRLPDGKMTDDPDTYADAWLDLGNRVAAFFPGYVAVGYNPGVSFAFYGLNGLGQRVRLDTFSLSTDACYALLHNNPAPKPK